MNRSKIPWTDFTWSPVSGCSKISPGCAHCYAEAYHRRFRGGDFSVKLHPEKLDEPLRKAHGFEQRYGRRPRVFVCPMADLFHASVPSPFIERVFETMEAADHIDFLVLTKRARNLKEWADQNVDSLMPNVWLGVTAENQEQADKRIPLLIETPAAIRFVSVEPMIGPINLAGFAHDFLRGFRIDAECCGRGHRGAGRGCCGDPDPAQTQTHRLDWVICGGESGPKARPMQIEWVRSLRDQCARAKVPFFYKQWGPEGGPMYQDMPDLDGKVHVEFPVTMYDRLRVTA